MTSAKPAASHFMGQTAYQTAWRARRGRRVRRAGLEACVARGSKRAPCGAQSVHRARLKACTARGSKRAPCGAQSVHRARLEACTVRGSKRAPREARSVHRAGLEACTVRGSKRAPRGRTNCAAHSGGVCGSRVAELAPGIWLQIFTGNASRPA
jgi:hypothetical protein